MPTLSTQIQLPETISGPLYYLRRILSEMLPEGSVKSLETNPHITVCYGIQDAPGMFGRVEKVIQSFPQFRVKFGRIRRFSKVEGGGMDAIYIEALSPLLTALARKLGELRDPSVHDRPYVGHVTLAYVQAGVAGWLDGMDAGEIVDGEMGRSMAVKAEDLSPVSAGREMLVQWVNFCTKDRYERQVSLGVENEFLESFLS